jgi:putative ABC transport system permease protein
MARRRFVPPPGPDDARIELEFHVEMLTRQYVEDGLPITEARANALKRVGDMEDVRRECRAIVETSEGTMQRFSWGQFALQDARYAARVLWQAPLFTLTALLTLAVGVGATTAIFSVVNAVLFRQLQYPAADRTVMVFNSYSQPGPTEAAISPEEFADLRLQSRAFDRWAAMRPQLSALTEGCSEGAGCEPERINASVVSPELFDLLGVLPQRGRPFTAADGVTGAAPVVLISDGLWHRRFGADPSVVGRVITLGGLSRVVIGIMPPRVQFPDDPIGYVKDRTDTWIPFNWQERKDGRGNQYLLVLGGLRSGVTIGQARADLAAITAGFKTRFPDRYAEPRLRYQLGSKLLREEMVGDVRTALIVLFGAGGCVLLIACANVANLILARGTSRRRELAVRSALGASRGRLVQQLLIETLVLTAAGTIIGILAAAGGLKALIALSPGNIPRLETVEIDAVVLGFAVALAVGTGILVGLLPALRQSSVDPQGAIADGTRGTAAAPPRRRLRGLLVIGEVAMAVVVLTGTILLIRSFVAMSRVSTGFDAAGAAIAQLSIPRATYDTPEKVFAFHAAMAQRLASLPGVSHASAVYPLPMSGEAWSGSVGIVGFSKAPGDPGPHTEYAVALPGYFQTVRIPLIEGRDFAATDLSTTPAVAIVDTVFAGRYWPGQSAIGKRIATGGEVEKGPFQTVIGVVGHVRNKGPRAEGEAQLYLAALQKPELSLFFVSRATSDPRTLMPLIRPAVREQDAKLPVAMLSTGSDLVAKFSARDRFNVLLFTIFGAVALALAAIGLYGVLAFLVTQRTHEIGIRLALGGQPWSVMRGIIGEGLALTAAGLVLGLSGGVLLAYAIRDLLFQIEPADPLTYCAIVASMTGVALLAAFGPALKAAMVTPMDVLRG